jgi:ABC-type multidrug transport system permease subunit
MKLLDITLKDILQASRSRTIFFFMFVIPFGISLLFMLMFGGVGDDEGFQLPTIEVVIVNLDEGRLPEQATQSFTVDGDGPSADSFNSMGELLVQLLQSEAFADLMNVTVAESSDSAMAAVDSQDAGVAVILPADFTASLIEQGASSTVELYQDPTLTISPLIVEAIVTQILDSFDSAKIGMDVTMERLAASGLALDGQRVQDIVLRFTTAFSDQQGSGDSGEVVLVTVQPPPGVDEETDPLTEIVGVILGGMMIFFAFFTAAASMETILVEEERGTLARLFTTPTSHRTILGGKALSALIILIFQLIVLMTAGALVMNIYWGTPPSVILAATGIILVAVATGSFLVSMMQNTRQGGIIFGGVLTMTGMLGLIPVFTSGNPNQPEALQIVSLLVPQGWAMRGLQLSIDGATFQEMLPVFGVILLWTIVLAFIGQHRLRKRFA